MVCLRVDAAASPVSRNFFVVMELLEGALAHGRAKGYFLERETWAAAYEGFPCTFQEVARRQIPFNQGLRDIAQGGLPYCIHF